MTEILFYKMCINNAYEIICTLTRNDFMILHIYSLNELPINNIERTCVQQLVIFILLNHFAIPNLINKSINLLYSNVFARVNGVCP